MKGGAHGTGGKREDNCEERKWSIKLTGSTKCREQWNTDCPGKWLF